MPFELAADDHDRFVGIPEAAARLGIHVVTARRWIREGRFPLPVQDIGGQQKVSLKLLLDHIHRGETA